MHMHHMHMSPAEYRMQNTECAPDRPTCSFHAFWGILYAAAEYRMRAGPSNMQFPRLLGDSVCCGRIQNAGRRMQGYWKTPTSAESKVFENTESGPTDSISPPATSPHLPYLATSSDAPACVRASALRVDPTIRALGTLVPVPVTHLIRCPHMASY